MKIKLLILLLCISTLSNAQIKFVKGSWSEILNRAKNENKMIFVDIYSPW